MHIFHLLLVHVTVLVGIEIIKIRFIDSLSITTGQRFALLEEKVFLSSIIRRFHLTTSQTYNDLIPVHEIILRSDNPLKVKLSSRA
jgi:hypothetical protein